MAYFIDRTDGGADESPVRREQDHELAPLPFHFIKEALPTLSGYLPVDRTTGSRVYYVYYEASNSPAARSDTPLMLWLNGGPGCSSLIGCFYELGPWVVAEDGILRPNSFAWNRKCGLLFVDSPVGTGFSVAESDMDIPTDQERVAKHLEFALLSFLEENPTFKTRPLFLAGESYAGKYVPALAYHILHQSRSGAGTLKHQLAGIAIGNGLTDPRTQVQCHGEVAFSFGLLDKRQTAHVDKLAREVVDLIDRDKWLRAHERRTAICSYIEKTSGVATLLDIRRTTKYHHSQEGEEFLAHFLNSPPVKRALRVDEDAEWVSCRRKVRAIMAQDTMKSTKWMVEEILRMGYPVLLYQGIYDAKDGPSGSEAWMRTLEWPGAPSFWRGERSVWKVNGELAGYWRRGQNLTHVVVAGAGHQVPADQPEFGKAMIESWMKQQLERR
ncbi:vitellogenic carboxypeptidase-like protein [Marchantia polymorpha subsp. ruderalis]|uniref:Carboxypeptidase n=1 Tax=Marchantia polymorpha TaxID=3197 RepID=A0A2R6XDJ8_MARPO|nr:hypothetical protein MARPO_0021s0045 [Marchantia polymorpha]BBN01246.1 hypothetical protein Mp_2g05890 [Marchantia polymorpha subsp. ruderalis]|eukprot:PTQ44172.1 hypothetical protein MARPO_0021s0045 [Marchantia polymorpha]